MKRRSPRGLGGADWDLFASNQSRRHKGMAELEVNEAGVLLL